MAGPDLDAFLKRLAGAVIGVHARVLLMSRIDRQNRPTREGANQGAEMSRRIGI